MQERLSKVVGRTENIVTPVEGDDIFPILHRRLFTTIGVGGRPTRGRRRVRATPTSRSPTRCPPAYREAGYRERLARRYPFHPELVDILTNRWGSLSGFQRTRGALRTLAHTVKALAQRQHKAPLIHPGDVILADPGIRAEVHPVRRRELQGRAERRHHPPGVESRRRKTSGAAARWRNSHLATGLATTAFLNSFGSDRVLGASAAQMLLGVGRPGLSRGLIEDVRDALEASALVHAAGGRTVPVHHRAQPQQGRPGTRGRDRRRPDRRRSCTTRSPRCASPRRSCGLNRGSRASADLPDEAAAHPRHPGPRPARQW